MFAYVPKNQVFCTMSIAIWCYLHPNSMSIHHPIAYLSH